MMQLPSNTPVLDRDVMHPGHLVKQVSVDYVFMTKILFIAR